KTYADYFTYYEGEGKQFFPKGHRPAGYIDFLTDILHVQDQFCRLLSNTDRIEMRTLANMTKNESVSELDKYPYFFWMRRNREMVLSFRRYDDLNVGYAFYTFDASFLREFTGQFNSRWTASTEHGHPITGD